MAHDVSKLPKWAQDKIELLERQVASAQASAVDGREDDGTADAYIRHLSLPDEAIPEYGHVIFRVPGTEGHLKDAEIRADVQPWVGEIQELVLNSNEGALSVMPHSSNVVRIRVVR